MLDLGAARIVLCEEAHGVTLRWDANGSQDLNRVAAVAVGVSREYRE